MAKFNGLEFLKKIQVEISEQEANEKLVDDANSKAEEIEKDLIKAAMTLVGILSAAKLQARFPVMAVVSAFSSIAQHLPSDALPDQAKKAFIFFVLEGLHKKEVQLSIVDSDEDDEFDSEGDDKNE